MYIFFLKLYIGCLIVMLNDKFEGGGVVYSEISV